MILPKRKLALALSALFTLVVIALVPVASYGQSLVWAKSLGGVGADRGTSIAVDAAGNVYATGFFGDTADFDPGPGVFNLVPAGSEDVFVTKLDFSGSLVWARSFGGPSQDFGLGIAVDAAGNVYTTGYFNGAADFDPGIGVLNLTGPFDVFVSKLNSSGSLIWAKAMGGSGFDQGLGISVDGSGNVHVGGAFADTADFDPGAGVLNLTSAGFSDVFVVRLDPSGGLIWARSWGGAGFDFGEDLALDAAGNVHTTGLFQGTVDFDPGLGVSNLATSGPSDSDAFVSKLDVSGSLVWAKAMAGPSFEDGRGIAVDGGGNVITTGNFTGTTDFDPGPGTLNLTTAGASDLFVSKLSPSGNLVWARAMGGFGSDVGWSVAVDAGGNPHVAGAFEDTVDFDPGPLTANLTSAGAGDVFVVKLDAAGSLVWARALGGPSFDEGFGIAVNSGAATVHTTGLFYGTSDFDPEAGVLNLTSAGSEDVFLSKLGPSAVPACTITGSGSITGTPGDDVICGSALADSISGLAGNDLIFGGGGNDSVTGGAGNDQLYGGEGNDNLSGGAGDDRIFGGNGNDNMTGLDGADLIDGQAGSDQAGGGNGTDSCSAEVTTLCP